MNHHVFDHYEGLQFEYGFSDRQIRSFQHQNECELRVLDIQDALSVVASAHREMVGLWISAYRTTIGREVGRKLKEEIIDVRWFKNNSDAINIKLAYYALSNRIEVIPSKFADM